MKNQFLLFCLLLSILIGSCRLSDSTTTLNETKKIPLKDRMDLAWAQEKEMTKDLSLGYVPTERLINGWEFSKSNLASKAAAINNVNWFELGPKNCGGRTRALCVDLNDVTNKTVFAGSVGGGLWKTTDITASAPAWLPVNDFFGNIAITSIAQDPLNKQNIYFSTGEGYGNIDAIRGLGIWKSADGGTTWNQLASTNNSTFHYNQKVLVTASGVLFVSSSTGLYRSANGGTSFTKVLGTGLSITGATSNFCYDVELAANGDMYASLNSSLHKSTDGGLTWGAALPIGVTGSRIEIALAPNDANYVYVLCESASMVSGIALSINAGVSFTAKTEPADAEAAIPATDFSRGQAWYNLTIAVDPNNRDVVFVGGIDYFKSVNGGSTWQQISHWYGGFGFQEVHSDMHNIVFSPGSSSIAYFLNDGGIYRTANAEAAIPTIISKEGNYNTTQFYAAAMDPTAGSYNFLAGSQDNGSHKFSTATVQNSIEVTGGDGMFCHIDQNEAQYWFTSYVYNNYYRSSNNGGSFTQANSGNTGRFINPTDYDDVANMMYCAKGNNEYLRWDNPQTGNTFTTVPLLSLGGQISAVKVSPNTANRVYFATNAGKLVMADNANTLTPTATVISTGLPAAYIACIEVQTGNDNHIIVTYTNYGTNSIWETINGGTTWTSVEGNLPDMPVRWALFNPNNTDQLMIATELGVWSTDDLNGTSTIWGSSNTGLANVRVDMLQLRQSDKLVIAATHGRGLYYTGVFAPAAANFNASDDIIYPGRYVQFSNTSFNATDYAWNFGDGTTSTVANPAKQYNVPGVYNVTLGINSGALSIVKTISVLPKRNIPYALANGGNFETNPNDFIAKTISGTGWERGSSAIAGKNGTNSGSNAWVTGLTGNYVDNSESYLYGPEFIFSAAGTYNFSFYTKYVAETNYDGLRVEYSLDTGKIWTPLGTTVVTNWYNFANTVGDGAFPVNQAFFTGSFGGAFVRKNYDASFLAGNAKVAFRIAFKSDFTVNAAGIAIDDIEVTGPLNILPSRLISFDAVKQNKDALLKWTTANETNVSHHNVERSWDGITFTTLQNVTAQNYASNNYIFTDLLSALNRAPGDIVYYRLKSTDINGSVSRSNIVQLKWLSNQTIALKISPNPFKDFVLINADAAIKSVQLVGLKGEVIFTTSSINNGRINLPPHLTGGVYFLKINSEKGVFVEKLMKE